MEEELIPVEESNIGLSSARVNETLRETRQWKELPFKADLGISTLPRSSRLSVKPCV
jgi:hypothetical protein